MENFDALALNWDAQPQRDERARTVAVEITIRIPNLQMMHGFEYGCGTGLLSFHLQPFLRGITLGDSSTGMLAVLEQKILKLGLLNMHPLRIDLTTDPAPKENYDLIYIWQ